MFLTLIEFSIYLVSIIAFFLLPPIHTYFMNLPRPHQCITATLIVLLLVGQFINDPRLTFPFTSWAMYGRPEHPETLVFYRFQGLDDEQKSINISPEDLLPAIEPSAIASKVKNLVRESFSSEYKEKQKESREKLRELLLAIGKTYNSSNPHHQIRYVELIQCSVNLGDRGKSGILQQPLWRVSLDSRSFQ